MPHTRGRNIFCRFGVVRCHNLSLSSPPGPHTKAPALSDAQRGCQLFFFIKMASYKQECRRYPYPFWYPLDKSDIFLISSQRTYPERRLMRHESCTRKTSPPTDIFYSFSPAENPPHNFGLTSPLEKYGKIIHFLNLSASGQPHFHISSPDSSLIYRSEVFHKFRFP